MGEAEDGRKRHIAIYATGSGNAFNDERGLAAKHPCDIGMASRQVTEEEANRIIRAHGQWVAERGTKPGDGAEHVIAMDGVAIIVHPDNPIKKLTVDTLRRIYSGETTDWSMVNRDTGHTKTGKINVLSRAEPSGTREFFIEKVMRGTQIICSREEKVKRDKQNKCTGEKKENIEVVKKVADDPYAIGFVSESYIDFKTVKAVNISNTGGLDKALPCSRDQIRSEEYYLSRPLYLYTLSKPEREDLVRRFLRFTLREEIQSEVVDEAARFISIIDTNYEIKEPTPAPTRVPPEILLRIHGSDTIGESLAILLAKRFLKQKGARDEEVEDDKSTKTTEDGAKLVTAHINGSPKTIEIKAKNSSFGFRSLAGGACDIAMSSDAISTTMKSLLRKSGFPEMDGQDAQFPIGYDALGIVVNRNNSVDALSISDVRSIFTGGFTKWEEVKGKNGLIRVYSRKTGSGTRQFFRKRVLNEAGIRADAKIREHNQEIAEAVAADPSGISYLPLPKTQGTKPLTVNNGKLSGSNESNEAERNLYSMKRTLYLYIPPSSAGGMTRDQRNRNKDAKKFVQMAQDYDQGQEDVNDAGLFHLIYPDNDPLIVVHFDFNDGKLDSESKSLIKNALDTIRKHPEWGITQVSVTGFSDIIGDDQACVDKALERARSVRDFLRRRGVVVSRIQSGGKLNLDGKLPGADPDLLRQDRRAEIWVER
ncbi:MAG: substrate-binding domain-containing protein [Deltaproteobacteria bacterium]|nr:substrate-binding domain-containing protein [Deltaproteobacteria bacterium]